MSDDLFSDQWYRVADLQARIRKHLKVHRQVHRGKTWYILEDESNGRHHRLDPIAYAFIGRLDGEHSVEYHWERLLEELGDDAPSQDDIVRLIGLLHQSDLIQCDIAPDVEELFQRQERRDHKRRLGQINPLAFRLRLLDPTRLLDRLVPLTGWIFSRGFFTFWLLVVGWAGVLLGQHWAEVSEHALRSLPSSRYWLLAFLCYPVIKALHEMAHALAVRHFSGAVHEMGVTLLVMMPVPYMDASAATAFNNKYHRIVVSAAGIMAEVFIASVALFVWLNVSDGLIRDLAFVTTAIGGISTVLFNANPLVKFDGYHMLADWLEIPNLAQRSKVFWAHLARRRLLGAKIQTPMTLAPGEARWLAGYGLLSWLYRLGIMVVLVGWFSQLSLWLAAAVGLMFLYALLLKPAWEIGQYLLHSSEIQRHRARAWGITAASVVTLLLIVVALPMPYATVAQGVIWIDDEARMRTGAKGTLTELLVEDGERVEKGQPLFRLDNPLLLARQRQLEAELDALDARYNAVIDSDSAKLLQIEEEIRSKQAERDDVAAEIAALTVTAPVSGTAVLSRPEDRLGTFVGKGELLGYVLPDDASRLRAVIPQADAALVKTRTRDISVRLNESGANALPARLVTETPSATYRLPSAALAYAAGGPVLTDPDDPDHLTTLEPVFIVDVQLPRHQVSRIGERAWLRFDHGHEPLLTQWMLRWKQLFISHLSNNG